MSSVSPNRLKPLDPRMDPHREPVEECPTDGESLDKPTDAISEEEVAEIRREKLETIKKAIRDGVYDSDELLDTALGRMYDAVENDKS